MTTIAELEKEVKQLKYKLAELRALVHVGDIYVLNDEERAAVEEGLKDVGSGNLVPEAEAEEFFKKYGVI